jgi:SagB-type dehydrogenase family enzyme
MNIPDDLLFSPSEIYHENSKVRRSDAQAHARIFMFNSSPEIRTVLARPMPSFRGKPTVKLPDPWTTPGSPFTDLVHSRRSAKTRFIQNPLDLMTLSRILGHSCGITAVTTDDQNITWTLRASPSGGALYPLDTYVIALTVEGIAPGLYIYQSSDHSLGLIREGDFAHDLGEASALGRNAELASVCVLLAATMGRSKVKYGERAYRFFLLEAGHIAQNILLAATDAQLTGVPVGGFIDDEVNLLLGLDGCTEAVLYMVFIGKL